MGEKQEREASCGYHSQNPQISLRLLPVKRRSSITNTRLRKPSTTCDVPSLLPHLIPTQLQLGNRKRASLKQSLDVSFSCRFQDQVWVACPLDSRGHTSNSPDAELHRLKGPLLRHLKWSLRAFPSLRVPSCLKHLRNSIRDKRLQGSTQPWSHRKQTVKRGLGPTGFVFSSCTA